MPAVVASIVAGPTPRTKPAAKAAEPFVLRANPTVHAGPTIPSLELHVLDDAPAPEVHGLTHERIRDVYLAAEEERRMPIAFVAATLDVPRGWANQWVKECRERGLLPPRDVPQRERVAPALKVLRTSSSRSGFSL
jgi:hypothetical protein